MYPSVKTIAQRLGVNKEEAKEIRGLMEGDINPDDVERVEQITDSQWDNYWCDSGLLYVNMGATYTETICYDTRKDQWIVCPWGDIVERNEKRFG
jgi:hypothetical protein